MTRTLVAARVRFLKAVEARELGQGTMEYVGMLVAVAVVVLAVATALKATNLGGKVQDAFTQAFS